MGLSHSPRIVTDGLVFHIDAANIKSYPGSGTTWSDLSGNGNDGTLTNGPTYSTGSLGSFSFDGINDYASVPDISGITDFTNTNNYSIDFWFYANSTQNTTTNADNDIVEKWSQSGGYPYVFRYRRATQTVDMAVYNPAVGGNSINVQISNNNWWNITGVFDWSNSSLKGFCNSVLMANTALTITGDITNSSPLYLMCRGGNLNFLTGKLSCLKIYNRALSETEIKQNFNALRGRFGI